MIRGSCSLVGLATLGLVVFLSGCTTATRLPAVSKEEVRNEERSLAQRAEQELIERTQRVANASWPILHENADLCADFVSYRTGIWISHETRIVTSVFVTRPESKIVIGRDPYVWAIARDSPAADSELRVGDYVKAINGKEVRKSGEARRQLRKALLRHEGGPISLEVMRDGKARSVQLDPVMACRSEIRVVSDHMMNASASGDVIRIYNGLLDFVESDTELQFVIAHELAHNAAKHVPKALARATLGGVMDLLLVKYSGVWAGGLFTRLGLIAYSKKFEREADYLGMYYLANADISLEGLEAFWTRLASTSAKQIQFGLTHPSAPHRIVSMRKTREEIERKKAAGEPLVPEGH